MLPPKSPSKRVEQQQQNTFFQSAASLDFTSYEEFGRKRFQTDSSYAAAFSSSAAAAAAVNGGGTFINNNGNFSSSSSIFNGGGTGGGETGKRAQRIRATSHSTNINAKSAFGPGTFSSVWEPISGGNGEERSSLTSELTSSSLLFPSFADRFAPAVEESDALSRTINLLGFDDPLTDLSRRHNSSADSASRPRSISASFPTPSLDEEIYHNGPVPFGRTISSMAIMTELSEGLRFQSSPSSPGHNNNNSNTMTWQEHFQTPPMSLSPAPTQEPQTPLAEFIPENSVQPTSSLWIGNLDCTKSMEEITSIFSQFGKVASVRILAERDCAFVNFDLLEDALIAKDQLQGAMIGNCIVNIGFGKGEISTQDAQMGPPTKSLWVGNITPSTRPADLELVFSQYGEVESARVLTHKNCGFVNFVSLKDAIVARNEVNGREISGSIVKIGFAKVPATKSDGIPTVDQALANPAILSTLAVSALGRMEKANAWAIKPPAAVVLSSAATEPSSLYVSVDLPDVYSNDNEDTILPIPEIVPRKHDQNRFKEIRRSLDAGVTNREFEAIFNDIIRDADEVASDYIGNVVIQNVMERASDQQKLVLIQKCSRLMAALGVHKNGTWAAQKIIEYARTSLQMDAIVASLKPYAPALLMDQFGNYLIQCCLRLGSKNQFIFDSISSKIVKIGQGRFGARATKTCLESSYTTKAQQQQVSLSIVKHCVQLSMNSNGSILLTWLLDVSVLPGKYRVVVPLMISQLQMLACHKHASLIILKLLNQRVEMDARSLILKRVFEEPVLSPILSDHTVGVPFISKILANGCVSSEEKAALVKKVKNVVSKLNPKHKQRLLDEIFPSELIQTRRNLPTPAQSP